MFIMLHPKGQVVSREKPPAFLFSCLHHFPMPWGLFLIIHLPLQFHCASERGAIFNFVSCRWNIKLFIWAKTPEFSIFTNSGTGMRRDNRNNTGDVMKAFYINILALKGSMTRDFPLIFFLINQFHPGPWVSHWGHLKFLRKSVEICCSPM